MEQLGLLFDRVDVAPNLVAGVDEAGRGPLAGPVCAAAVILDPRRPIEGLADSKKLTAKKRERLAKEIKEKALAWAIAWGEVEAIDSINILQATMQAMTDAVQALSVRPQKVLIDGNRIPKQLTIPAQAIVKGDAKEPAISAASILAKTARDHLLIRLDQQYPRYGFAKHMGYGTAAHIQAILRHGILPIHRKSFAPIRRWIANPEQYQREARLAKEKARAQPSRERK